MEHTRHFLSVQEIRKALRDLATSDISGRIRTDEPPGALGVVERRQDEAPKQVQRLS
jgi:hypothetical protein